MKKTLLLSVCLSVLLSAVSLSAEETEQANKPDQLAGTMKGLQVKNLLAEKLDITDSIEVVVSQLVVPPNTVLPMHWHHGEEFIYVLEGSAIIILKDKPDTEIATGDVFKIPLRQIHTAKTTDDSCTVVVFRIHEEGKPTRVLVEEK